LRNELVCIVCPMSCKIEVQYEGNKVIGMTGYKCRQGKKYAEEEAIDPKRTLTTTVLLEKGDLPLLSVRTDKPMPKKQLFEAMEVLRKVKVSAPVEAGQVIVENLLGLGVNVIATRKALRTN
jgi:CxxC motif-containing protein